MITGWMPAPSTDNGLTKTAHDTAPSAKVGVPGIFNLRQILFMDMCFRVTPPSTICVSYTPDNYASAKVLFCLAKDV